MDARRALLAETIEVQVPFHDIDPADIVWHGHYVRYLAQARDALMNRIGYGHARMMATGNVFPIVDIRLRYLRPARLDQRLRVTAELVAADPMLELRYAITDATTGARLLRARSKQVAVRRADGQMASRAPAELLERIEAARSAEAARSVDTARSTQSCRSTDVAGPVQAARSAQSDRP